MTEGNRITVFWNVTPCSWTEGHRVTEEALLFLSSLCRRRFSLLPWRYTPSSRFVRNIVTYFYVYGSVRRWSILIIVQRDITQSSLFIILQDHSTRFGCQPRPSSGVHKIETTAFGTGHMFVQLPPSNVAKLAWPRWWEAAAQKRLYDQYRRLQLQFCVLLMMGVVDTRNM